MKFFFICLQRYKIQETEPNLFPFAELFFSDIAYVFTN